MNISRTEYDRKLHTSVKMGPILVSSTQTHFYIFTKNFEFLFRVLNLKVPIGFSQFVNIAGRGKEWTGKTIYLDFSSIFGDFFLKFFEEEVSDYLS